MSNLKYTGVSGNKYEVRRGAEFLGTVERVTKQFSSVSIRSDGSGRGRLSLVVRWRFQVAGFNPCALPYMTRKQAAEALAGQYDAMRRASMKQEAKS